MKGESHAREVARIFDITPVAAARAVRQLERDGLIIALKRGRTRVLKLNSRWFGKEELRELLVRMAEFEPALYEAAKAIRDRPWRSGKAF